MAGSPRYCGEACGGSPPSVLRRDSSSRLGGALPGGVLTGPPPFPRAGRPFHPIPRPRSSASLCRVILIRAWEVSFLRRCPGSPPVPRGTARLPEQGRNFLGSPPWPAPPLAPIEIYQTSCYLITSWRRLMRQYILVVGSLLMLMVFRQKDLFFLR